jgi:hypothetical protein
MYKDDCSGALRVQDRVVLDALAFELQRPDLPPERRSELENKVDEVADLYRCDPRWCE